MAPFPLPFPLPFLIQVLEVTAISQDSNASSIPHIPVVGLHVLKSPSTNEHHPSGSCHVPYNVHDSDRFQGLTWSPTFTTGAPPLLSKTSNTESIVSGLGSMANMRPPNLPLPFLIQVGTCPIMLAQNQTIHVWVCCLTPMCCFLYA